MTTGSMPAIFTHPRWANESQFSGGASGSADIPRNVCSHFWNTFTTTPTSSQQQGEGNDRRTPLATDFRTGNQDDVPYTAYGLTPPEGAATLPRGPNVTQPAPNIPLLQEMAAIHTMQQINMQRHEDTRQRKGKFDKG